MKKLWMLFFAITTFSSFAQEDAGLPKEKLYEARKQLREGNELYKKNKLDDAAIAYQKSLAEDGTYYKGAYNLGNAYFQQKKYKEAAEQYQLANKLAKTKQDKAKTSELIGDTFKKQNELEKALEAYKQALLKNPEDDILRQKFVAAMKAKQKQDQQNKDNKDKNKDKDNKDDKKDKGDNKDKNKDQNKKDDKGDKDKNNDNKKDGENPEDKKDQGDKSKDEKQQQPAQPKESKLSPEQIQQLLESMNNEEQKTQKKVNAQKVNAKENNNEKDW
ncbi:tetratricopeptide repeat protein [Wenyingzhuangia sp. chi5]|uniref:Tetratricopeptide repeat protein n=1 Tax=Wenyingzhuangia gilva TaxID=3057677 RepID=A0ABT8VPV3_9FLAO|nr:tetratricopeptide repeat protein [Wenyingzhuangia sp. chi5]MDO3693991.1 tetratricopeptide repeat protein [Wenyingzhuangia sp. chi5]